MYHLIMFFAYLLLGYLIGQIVPFEGVRVDRAVSFMKECIQTFYVTVKIYLAFLCIIVIAEVLFRDIVLARRTVECVSRFKGNRLV